MHIVHKQKGTKGTGAFLSLNFFKIVDKNKILVDNNCDYQKDEKVRHLKSNKGAN